MFIKTLSVVVLVIQNNSNNSLVQNTTFKTIDSLMKGLSKLKKCHTPKEQRS
jgi:hypothetical protein